MNGKNILTKKKKKNNLKNVQISTGVFIGNFDTFLSPPPPSDLFFLSTKIEFETQIKGF